MKALSIVTKRAIGYCRVSTESQSGEHHSSLETQESRYKDYCTKNGLIPMRLFVDIASGRKDDRKSYNEMLKYASEGQAEVVVVQFLDRFGRNPREILRRYWDLQERGVQVVATDEDLKEEMLLLVKAGMAGAESRRIGERVRINMRSAAEKGTHMAKAPYGLKPIKKIEGSQIVTVGWEIDPTQAEAIRKMFQWYVHDGMGLKRIADTLNESIHRTNSGKVWSTASVQKILTNEHIAGTMLYGRQSSDGRKEPIIRKENYFPAIITRQEWDMLQSRMVIRRERPHGAVPSSPYLLSGVAYCGYCGGPMVGHRGRAYKGKVYGHYLCSRAQRAKSLCSISNGHSAKPLEKAVLEFLSQYSDERLVRQKLAVTRKTDTQRHEKQLKTVNKQLEDSDREFLMHLDLLKRGSINEGEFNKANAAIRNRSEKLQADKERLESLAKETTASRAMAEQIPAKIVSFMKAFEGMAVQKQKAALQSIVKAVHIWKEGRLEVEFR